MRRGHDHAISVGHTPLRPILVRFGRMRYACRMRYAYAMPTTRIVTILTKIIVIM